MSIKHKQFNGPRNRPYLILNNQHYSNFSKHLLKFALLTLTNTQTHTHTHTHTHTLTALTMTYWVWWRFWNGLKKGHCCWSLFPFVCFVLVFLSSCISSYSCLIFVPLSSSVEVGTVTLGKGEGGGLNV